MSGTSSTEVCPRCGGKLETYTDWKPHDTAYGFCFSCGFSYETTQRLASRSEVNERRADMDDEERYPQLTKLSEPLAEWIDNGWEAGLVRESNK